MIQFTALLAIILIWQGWWNTFKPDCWTWKPQTANNKDRTSEIKSENDSSTIQVLQNRVCFLEAEFNNQQQKNFEIKVWSKKCSDSN